MSVTPLQLARYTAALGNGGRLPTPHLIQKAVHPETGRERSLDLPPADTIPVDSVYFGRVQEGMHRVMREGTGRWVQIPNVPSAGKTGTAQNPHGQDHSLFIMFAPYEDPEIALAVTVENAGYGATAAAPLASLMAEQYLTGTIADTWERRYWQRRLREEVRSGPGQNGRSPSPSPASPPATQVNAQPADAPSDSTRADASSR
jgi:penicillin-binding protein 2